jgi:hypothetical protein
MQGRLNVPNGLLAKVLGVVSCCFGIPLGKVLVKTKDMVI